MRAIIILFFALTTMSAEVPPYLRDVVGKTPDKQTLSRLSGEERSTFLQSWVMLRFHDVSPSYETGEKKVVPTLAEPMRHHYFVFRVGYSVSNGGLTGYFDVGDPPQFVPEAIAAFEAIGARKQAQLLREASPIFAKRLQAYRRVEGTAKEESFFADTDAEFERLDARCADLDWFLLKERLKYIEQNIGKFHR